MVFEDRIYYQDQTHWHPDDYRALWRYLNRLLQFIDRDTSGEKPLPGRRADPLTLQIRARRAGKRDAELTALDPSRMSEDTRYLMKHMLIRAGLFEHALALLPNLEPLREVGELDHLLVLDTDPTYAHPYYTKVGIIL